MAQHHVGGSVQTYRRAPLWPLGAAAGAVLASLAVLTVGLLDGSGEPWTLGVVGYALGAVVAAVFVVVHRGLVVRARSEVWFSPRPWEGRAATVLLALGVAVALVHAYAIATELAR